MPTNRRIGASCDTKRVGRVEDLVVRQLRHRHNDAEAIIGHDWNSPTTGQDNGLQFVECPVRGLLDSKALNKLRANIGGDQTDNKSHPKHGHDRSIP